VTALGLAGGLILGLVLAAMQLSRFWLLAAFARGYTVIFRGTPLILQWCSPTTRCRRSAETQRDRRGGSGAGGQRSALHRRDAARRRARRRPRPGAGRPGARHDAGRADARIIAPQAIRMMIPAFGNETVSALKNSSLASVISVQELTLRSTQLASSTFDFFSIFFASGLIYLVLTGASA
jgi:polar amino acid transport system permease protein